MSKKIIVLVLLSGFLYGCGDGGSENQESCKMDSLEPMCGAGTLISYCQSSNGSNDGKVVLSGVDGRTLVCFKGVGNYCEGGQLKKGGYCKGGKISVICRNNRVEEVNDNCESLCDASQYVRSCDATGKMKYCMDGLVHESNGPVCDGNTIYRCENSVLKKGSFCSDNKSVYCVSGVVQRENCAEAQQQCVEYSRGENSFTSNCADNIIEGCGDFTNLGKCDESGETLTFCSKENKLVTLNCKKSDNKKCLHIEASYGSDCAYQCGENNAFTDFGTCSSDKKILKYCEGKKLREVDCPSMGEGLVCGFNGWFFDCLKDESK